MCNLLPDMNRRLVMELTKKFYRLLPFYLLMSPASAESIGGYISVLSGQSDNATKTSVNAIDERQDEYDLSLVLGYSNPFLTAAADYLVSERHFAEASQDDEAYMEGKASLYLGNEGLPADLLIKHSRRVLLQEPDQVQITSNLDERDIVSVIPTLRSAITAVDVLGLSGDYTEVKFAKNELRNSSRLGGNFRWAHNLSKTDKLNVGWQQMDIEFDAQPQADYTYHNATLSYSTELRSLAYSIQAGYNQSENSLQGDFDAPSYAIDIDYKKGVHQFGLMATKLITDSSLGDGNSNSVDSMPDSDGAAEIHQIDRTLVEARWTTSLLCLRCSSYMVLRRVEDNYITVEEHAIQTTAGFGISYQFSKAAKLSLGSENSRRRFEEHVVSNSYELSRIIATYYYQFSNHFNAKVIGWREDREKDETIEGYTESYAGIGLVYQF